MQVRQSGGGLCFCRQASAVGMWLSDFYVYIGVPWYQRPFSASLKQAPRLRRLHDSTTRASSAVRHAHAHLICIIIIINRAVINHTQATPRPAARRPCASAPSRRHSPQARASPPLRQPRHASPPRRRACA